MKNSLFQNLREACIDDWRDYVEHPFIMQLGDGSLPEASFKKYLVQDYLFLIHFARAYALVAYKSQDLASISAAADSLRIITDVEMGLHVEFSKAWGLSEADMQAAPEAEETMAYTRYVLECGLAGDVLDLQVALAPCMCGYAEIGKFLMESPKTKRDENPYMPWIEMYASAEYQEGTDISLQAMDRLFEKRGSKARMPDLARIFGQATRLESRFWKMGLDAAS